MGNCFVTKAVNCLTCTADCLTCAWEKPSCRKKVKRPVVLLVVGLDNAGKSAVVNYLFNKSLLTKENVVPTIGFRTVMFNYKSFSVRIYDVGGGPQIRALWPKYYADVHGVIYVVDANDIDRLSESSDVFQELSCHELIKQKPILFLGNKQDLEDALDEIDLIQEMNIENIVNFAKCYTRVEICSCYPDDNKHLNMNKNIHKGFEWLLDVIDFNYDDLEKTLAESRNKSKLRRSSINSWTAESYDNSFENSEVDSDVYIRPIIPPGAFEPTKRKKRKTIKSLFCIANNRTAPLLENEAGAPTAKTMKELIRSMKIEDLIKTTEVDENAMAAYRKPRKWKYRPQTAPAKVKTCAVNPIQRAESIQQM